LDEPEELNLGDNVIIVSEHDHQKPTDNGEDSETKTKTKRKRKTKKKVKRKVVKKRRVKK
jgi:hypothetical protein